MPIPKETTEEERSLSDNTAPSKHHAPVWAQPQFLDEPDDTESTESW